VLVRSVVAAAFDTNCYVLAAGPGQECVVVDPGIGVLTALDAVLAGDNLRPAAVLLTHGHLDHCFSVAPICGARGITAYVHPGDREMVADPAKGLSMSLTELFGGRLPYSEPENVAALPDAGTITVAAITHDTVGDKAALAKTAPIAGAVATALDEERAADEKLTEVAMSGINQEAAAGADE